MTKLWHSIPRQMFPPPNPSFSLTLSPAHPVLQAENPGRVWGSQRPRAPGDPGRFAGDAADGAGHRRCLRWQVSRARIGGAGDSVHQSVPSPAKTGDAPCTLSYSNHPYSPSPTAVSGPPPNFPCPPQKPVPAPACRLELVWPLVAQGSRTAGEQALWQLCALPLTLLLATLGGSLTGEFCPPWGCEGLGN